MAAMVPSSFFHLAWDLICEFSASHGHVGERAADPLHRARINAKTLGDAAYTFTSALTFVQGRLDSLFEVSGYPRPTKSFSLILGPPKPGADSFCDHRPLKLGKHTHHLTPAPLPVAERRLQCPPILRKSF